MSKDGGDDGYEVSSPLSVKWPEAAPRSLPEHCSARCPNSIYIARNTVVSHPDAPMYVRSFPPRSVHRRERTV